MSRGVVFDLDGTLLNTLDDIADTVNELLSAGGFPTHSVDSFRRFIGSGVKVLFRRALPAEEQSAADELAVRFGEAYERHWNVKTRPYAGVEQVLEQFRRAETPCGVLSNKPHAFTQRCVQEFFPQSPFRAVLGQRAGAAPKPDPGGAREVAALLDLPTSRIVYLGDSDVDMQTARRAGMLAVGAAWGFRSREELLASGAVEVLEHPTAMFDLLTRLGS